MPTKQELRKKLIEKLQELFQLDQPELDFGFYRIMHAKSKQVTAFLENDLFRIVEEAFADAGQGQVGTLKAAYEKAVADALEFGAPDPEATTPVKKAKAAYEAALLAGDGEAEVYEHLYRFFERYYEDGDFISRRYYVRETDRRAAPFAIPYHGEEVKLHWANADQYYIKTAEHFRNYSFDLRAAAKKHKDASAPELFEESDAPLMVHFKVVDADEGEHGDVKESKDSKRFFIVNQDRPVRTNELGEIEIGFEYRIDPEIIGKEVAWRHFRNEEAERRILETLAAEEKLNEFYQLLKINVPTDKDKQRSLLRRYIEQFSSVNSMDYFIHKDLRSFLRRELDFYLKNEVMRLDDLENSEIVFAETYLRKMQTIRRIARYIIDFLAQLEDFQKRLWLKKKFVIAANYCITLDLIPESLYGEIVKCGDQIKEWREVYSIHLSERSLMQPEYTDPPTIEFLKANKMLAIDTRFFDEKFKAKLLDSIANLDELQDGLLIESENFQALNLISSAYFRRISTVYLDPPYNTDASSILYKNGYKDSSWVSLIQNRLESTIPLMTESGALCFAIDDEEAAVSKMILSGQFEKELGVAVVRSNPQSRKTKGKFSPTHEYALFWGISSKSTPGSLEASQGRLKRYPLSDAIGPYAWMNFIRTGNNDRRIDRPKLFYPIYVSENDTIRCPKMEWDDEQQEYRVLEIPNIDETVVLPIKDGGIEKNWHRGHVRLMTELDEYRIRRTKDGEISIDFKTRMDDEALPNTWWDHKDYASANHGAAELKELFGIKRFDYPKAKKLVEDCLLATKQWDDTDVVLDFFGGSGTTGHAVIDLNRKYLTRKRFILIEMGAHFETVLKPRLLKVAYSPSWKDGKPLHRDKGMAFFVKYLRLESYEDTLNNLRIKNEGLYENLQKTFGSGMQNNYMMNYLLEVETEGSNSLINFSEFADPCCYCLDVKKRGKEGTERKAVDLIETFNYLIGLRVVHIAAPEEFDGSFKREEDPELPGDQHTRLVLDGKLKPAVGGKWWFRKVEGWVPGNLDDPNNGVRERVLIVWRKLTGNLEEDNVMLDEWFKKYRIDTQDREYDRIYVNGSNNLPNLKREGDRWTVELIEGEFHRRMWEVE